MKRPRPTPVQMCFIAVLATALVFFLAFRYAYGAVAATIRETTLSHAAVYADLRAQTIANAFAADQALIQQIGAQSQLSALAALQGGVLRSEDYARLSLLQEYIADNFVATDCFPQLLFLFDADTDFVVSSGFIASDFRREYESGLFALTDADYDAFIALVRAGANSAWTQRLTPARALRVVEGRVGAGERAYSLYIRRLAGSGAPVFAVLLIDAEALRAEIAYDSAYGDAAFLLRGASGTLYEADMGAAEPPDLRAGERAYVPEQGRAWFATRLSALNADALVALEDADVLLSIRPFTAILGFLLVACAATGAFTLITVLRRWILPLGRLARRGRGGSAAGSEALSVSYVVKRVSDLERENTDMAKSLIRVTGSVNRLEPMLRDSLIMRLFAQEALSPEESAALSRLSGPEDEAAFRAVYAGAMADGPFPDEADARARRAIGRALPEEPIYRMGPGRYAALLSGEPNAISEREALEETLKRLLEALNAGAGGPFAIGVGLLHFGTGEIRATYAEALDAFREACLWRNARVLFFDSTALGVPRYSLPYAQLDRLSALVCAGDAEGAGALIGRMAEENFGATSQNRQSRLICRQFARDVTGALLRASARLSLAPALGDAADESSGARAFDETLRDLRASAAALAELAPRASESAQPELFERVRACVMERFADPDMSLSLLSDRFGMSESGLSRYFKFKTGENFSSFLEFLRLSEAERLLLGSRLSVKDVAARVGYAQPATFYKAFKRKNGLSPSEWVGRTGSGSNR